MDLHHNFPLPSCSDASIQGEVYHLTLIQGKQRTGKEENIPRDFLGSKFE
jgi:hypothetical protein